MTILNPANLPGGTARNKPGRVRFEQAFTLLEVMIASAILFLCLFAVLGLLSTSLRNARALQRTTIDAGVVAAYFSVTNGHTEASESGTFEDLGNFGDNYRDLQWTRDSEEISTNGLWLEVYTIRRRSTGQTESEMSRLAFDPAPPFAAGIRGRR